ncbi:GPI mannosyltransferase 3-like [Mizuhopecten yessoensis]|uniref:GPI mannosyltransferase 3-like n=1 Tax=Mizuhopecten yessoensis TaxID=6573 RepID=UPI000B45729B|nr:GPI mannosyltransferase 3-like [Mizuhopecten yessoensis]
MPKEGKGAATIRRRKLKHAQDARERAKHSRPMSPIPSDNEQEIDEIEEGYIFQEEVLGPLIVKKLMATEKTIFLGLIALRICNALMIQTYFVPDEYWQSLEVAHKIVFNYGYLTWEWRQGIRSYFYPTIFAFLYKTLAVLGLDHRLLLIKLPRILQGVIAALGDLYLFKLSWKISDRATAQWTLLCQILSWFTLYCCTRTLSNCMETVVITMALYYFPWPNIKGSSVPKFVALAAMSVLIRPTAVVIWILMCSWHLQNNQQRLQKDLKHYFIIGSVCFLGSTFLDCAYHGDWIVVHYNFLEFNVLHGGGSIYGTHPWHWYLTQGYPVIMSTHLLPFIVGAYKAKNKVLLFLIIWTIFAYSFIAHKEFRFLMPILPISMHYCGVYFQALCRKPRLKKKKVRKDNGTITEEEAGSPYSSSDSLVSSVSTESTASTVSTGLGDNQSTVSTASTGLGDSQSTATTGGRETVVEGTVKDTSDTSKPLDGATSTLPGNSTYKTQQGDKAAKEEVDPLTVQKTQHKYNLLKAKIFVVILVIINIPTALYFGLIHQRGTVVVMKYLHDQSLDKSMDILFLTPCHSTPYYSYLHQNISMRMLTCEPNLSRKKNYTDEADQFYNDPVQWLKHEYKVKLTPLPSHIVYFNKLQNNISEFFTQSGYKKCGNFFHTHFPEGRVGSHVRVSCR